MRRPDWDRRLRRSAPRAARHFDPVEYQGQPHEISAIQEGARPGLWLRPLNRPDAMEDVFVSDAEWAAYSWDWPSREWRFAA